MNNTLTNGIWVYNTSGYAIGNEPTWTGASGTSLAPSAPVSASCCSNWTNAGTNAFNGVTSGVSDFLYFGASICNTNFRVFCVEP